ncbi:hypothetical protein PIB30_057455 [Stylosanthes scabra]|uniref:Uncharacterized protein n=1 Tax=Stylosanthes scabra TaxID=79078 RepID=A0ABU6YK51_9FABA|nr:hypothetical protein [Stylosanthes scabra]
MVSGAIYYEYEKHEKFEDYDMKADAELGSFKIRRYHFDDEFFVHPLHNVRFDPDRPYEIPIEAQMADQSLSSSKDEKSSTRRSHSSRRPTPQYFPKGISSTQCVRSTSSTKGTSSFHRKIASSSLRMHKSWELIPPSEGWMCEGDDEKEIGGMESSVKKEESSEENRRKKKIRTKRKTPRKIPASSSLPMDIDATEDYLRFIEDLEHRPEPSPLHSSQASVSD